MGKASMSRSERGFPSAGRNLDGDRGEVAAAQGEDWKESWRIGAAAPSVEMLPSVVEGHGFSRAAKILVSIHAPQGGASLPEHSRSPPTLQKPRRVAYPQSSGLGYASHCDSLQAKLLNLRSACIGDAKCRSAHRVECHLIAFGGPWSDDRVRG